MTSDKEHERALSYFSLIQKKWGMFSEKHECGLIDSLRTSSIENELIDTGIFINLRRNICRWGMVSEKHPYTKRLFKSISQIENEKTRHLVKYKYMIHPFSMANFYYDIFMAFVYLCSLIYVIPSNWAFVRYYKSTLWYTFALDMTVTASMCFNFFIGYFDRDAMRIQLRPMKVMLNYMRSYFFFDLLSNLTSYLIVPRLAATGPTYLNLVKWTMIFRLVRITSIESTLDIVRLHYGLSAAAYVSIQILLKVLGVMIFCSGMVMFVDQLTYLAKPISEDMDSRFAKNAIYRTVIALFGVGKVPLFETTASGFQFFVISVMSVFLYVWIIAKLYTIWERFLIASEIGEDHMQQLGSFLRFKALPANIAKEIYCYFDFNFQKNFFDEPTIMSMQSENLRREISNYKVSRGIEKIRFIRVLPHHVIMSILTNMTSNYYSPGDVIFKANVKNSTLYYMNHGSAALFDEKNAEVCHLEDDSYYGDISVIIPQLRTVQMTAISPCEICTISHHSLMNILDAFPDLTERVFEVSRQLLLKRKYDWYSSSVKSGHIAINTVEIKVY